MIKSLLTGITFAAIMGAPAAFAGGADITDLVSHEIISYSAAATNITFGGAQASPIDEVLEARISAGAYDAKFTRDLPEGSALVARMTYANYDFKPVWTPESAETLVDLCLSEDTTPTYCDGSNLTKTIDLRFVSGSPAERADADVALTKILLSYMAESQTETYTSGKWIEREPGLSEPILVASLREAGESDVYSGLDILDPVRMDSSNRTPNSAVTTRSASLP